MTVVFLLPGDWFLGVGLLVFFFSIAAFGLFLGADSVEEDEKKRRIFRWRNVLLSLWTTWVLFTLGTAATLYKSGDEKAWNHIPYAIFNFFTPIYLGNLRIYTLPVMFFGLMAGEWLGKRITRMALRVAFNLAALVLLTALMDMMVWGSWISGIQLIGAFSTPPPSIAIKGGPCSRSLYLTGPLCSRLPNDYERFYTAIAAHFGDTGICEKISTRAVDESGGSFGANPDVTAERSKCYFWAALRIKDLKLCLLVKRIVRIGFNESEVSAPGCLAMIKTGRYPSSVRPIADPYTVENLMRKLGYSDEEYYAATMAYGNTPVYHFFQSVKDTKAFRAKIDQLPSYDGPYSAEALRPANEDEMLFQMFAITSKLPDYCSKISPNSYVYGLIPGNSSYKPPLRNYCFYAIAVDTLRSALCAEIVHPRPAIPGDSSYDRDRCEGEIKLAVKPDEHYDPEFITMEEMLHTLQKLGYERSLVIGGIKINWEEFFSYLVDDAPAERKQLLLKRAEALPSFAE